VVSSESILAVHKQLSAVVVMIVHQLHQEYNYYFLHIKLTHKQQEAQLSPGKADRTPVYDISPVTVCHIPVWQMLMGNIQCSNVAHLK